MALRVHRPWHSRRYKPGYIRGLRAESADNLAFCACQPAFNYTSEKPKPLFVQSLLFNRYRLVAELVPRRQALGV
jgi:hypothetical protein